MPTHIIDGRHFPLLILADPADGTVLETLPVSVASIALPAGAATETTVAAVLAKIIAAPATETKQDTGNTSLATIAAKDFATQTTLALIKAKTDNLDVALSTRTKPADTQPISAAALPLPAGAATEAGNLATIAAKDFATQTTLALVKAKTDNIPAQGQALAAASTPVVLPAAQITTLTPPAAITGFALEAGHLAAIDTSTAKIPALGQAVAGSSVPVVLTAAQMTTLTPIAGNLEATQLLVKAKTDNLDVALSTRLKPADTLTGVTTVATVTAVTAITNALPAGANVVGAVIPVGGKQLDEGSVSRTVSRAFVNATLIGATQIVAAQGAGVKIRVLSVVAIATLGVTAKFQSAANDISAGFPVGINGGMVMPYNPHGWFETNANEALNINLSLATATGVQITWCPAT